MARPLVGHRELRLDRRILLAEFRETRPHPFQRRLSRQSFAGRSGAGEKRLDLPQLLAQLGLGRHRLASSLSLQSKALHSARPTSISFTPAIHLIPKAQARLPCSCRDAYVGPTCVPTLDHEAAYGYCCNRRKSELAISEFWRPDFLPADSVFPGRGSRGAFLASASPIRRVDHFAWFYARPNLLRCDCIS